MEWEKYSLQIPSLQVWNRAPYNGGFYGKLLTLSFYKFSCNLLLSTRSSHLINKKICWWGYKLSAGSLQDKIVVLKWSKDVEKSFVVEAWDHLMITLLFAWVLCVKNYDVCCTFLFQSIFIRFGACASSSKMIQREEIRWELTWVHILCSSSSSSSLLFLFEVESHQK